MFDRDENDEMELDDLRNVLNNLPEEIKPDEIEECLNFYDLENKGKLSLTSTA